MNRILMFFLSLPLFYLLAGCQSDDDKRAAKPDIFNRGTIHISCDETFKPVIDQEVLVYQSLYPGSNLVVHYKPEAECLKDFLVDSIRMVIATRPPSEAEIAKVSDSFAIALQTRRIARDLIAVIQHPSNPDSFYTLMDIRDLVSGNLKKDLIPVFDGTSATSTVRFMLDSVLKDRALGKQVVAAASTVGVIDYVSKTPNAVGFVGYSWIGNKDDTTQLAYQRKFRTAYLESTDSADAYVSPSQYFIYTKSYPMVRDLVCVLKEKHNGLGSAFLSFLSEMRGQLIFRRAYLAPAIFPNYVRDARLQDTIGNY